MHNTELSVPHSLIARYYLDIHQQQQKISEDTERRLRAALEQRADQRLASGSLSPLPPVLVFTSQQPVIKVAGYGDYYWVFTSEQAQRAKEEGSTDNFKQSHRRHQGKISAGELLTFPASLEYGYHSLTLSQQKQQWQCRIIIAPTRCYQPAALSGEKSVRRYSKKQNGKTSDKCWGACVQLYTLRSLNNWGVGDFGDLQKFLRDTARYHMAFIGLNPLHALYPAQPDNASPYSPSSRHWLNIIYIDVNAVEDFQLNEEAERWWMLPDTQQRLEQARNSEWVDYPAVMELKLTALSIAWKKFVCRDERDKLRSEFRQFAHQGGDSLYWLAVHDAVHQYLVRQNPAYRHWGDWPAEWQQPDSEQVQAFRIDHASEVEFYCWLQWLAQRQLIACQQICQQTEMPIGLFTDLAVGEAQYSAASWRDRSLYCLDMAIGAPADPLGPQGQNWQLPPVNPCTLAQRAYQPFIDLLQANMRFCGALRIDHVMSLMRLWWVPQGKEAADGAYVHYPLQDLLAILALESQRHQCMIIGEDLGVVPGELRQILADAGIFSYKVLYFECDDQHKLPKPEQWPAQALATVNTHDLATLRGYWGGSDLSLGVQLGIYTDEQQLNTLYKQRQQQKQHIIDSLRDYHCLPSHGKPSVRAGMTPLLRRAIYRYIASCNSMLVGLQPEDWLDMELPVNVPGTTSEYPNWRRKLSRMLDDIFIDSTIPRLFAMLNKYRKQASNKQGFP